MPCRPLRASGTSSLRRAPNGSIVALSGVDRREVPERRVRDPDEVPGLVRRDRLDVEAARAGCFRRRPGIEAVESHPAIDDGAGRIGHTGGPGNGMGGPPTRASPCFRRHRCRGGRCSQHPARGRRPACRLAISGCHAIDVDAVERERVCHRRLAAEVHDRDEWLLGNAVVDTLPTR